MALKYCGPCCFMNQRHTAEFMCLDCQERYCERCRLHHTTFRVLRRHEIIKINSQLEEVLPESNDHERTFDTGNVYVPFEETLKHNDRVSKGKAKVTITRSLSCSDICISTDKSVQELHKNMVIGESTNSKNEDKDFVKEKNNEVIKDAAQELHALEDDYSYTYVKIGDGALVELKNKSNFGRSTGSDNDYYDDAVTPDRSEKEDDVRHHYIVHIEESDLAKVMGIENKTCTFKIHADKICILADSNFCFEALFKTIRRYRYRENIITIEFGRASRFGQGALYLKSSKATEIHLAFGNAMQHA